MLLRLVGSSALTRGSLQSSGCSRQALRLRITCTIPSSKSLTKRRKT